MFSIHFTMKDERRRRFVAYFTRKYGDDRARFMADTGLTKGRVSQLFDPAQPFGELAARRLAEALGLPSNFFEADQPASQITAPVPDPGETAELEPAGRARFVRRIPVVGTAKLGEDGYFERVEGDGWITGYTDDQDAYALRVKGDSMHPAIRHGHFVAVAPNSCCIPGEYVVIELRSGCKMVKELIFERADEIVIESVNGNHRRTIEKSEIDKMQPVVAVIPPSRWRPD